MFESCRDRQRRGAKTEQISLTLAQTFNDFNMLWEPNYGLGNRRSIRLSYGTEDPQ
jgi:hypothetical protein